MARAGAGTGCAGGGGTGEAERQRTGMGKQCRRGRGEPRWMTGGGKDRLIDKEVVLASNSGGTRGELRTAAGEGERGICCDMEEAGEREQGDECRFLCTRGSGGGCRG